MRDHSEAGEREAKGRKGVDKEKDRTDKRKLPFEINFWLWP